MPIDKVKVINSRNRDQEQFDMNVESIGGVGLMKPIRVNDKFLESTGKYELICGEGRLLAHIETEKACGEPTSTIAGCTKPVKNISEPGPLHVLRRDSRNRHASSIRLMKCVLRSSTSTNGSCH